MCKAPETCPTQQGGHEEGSQPLRLPPSPLSPAIPYRPQHSVEPCGEKAMEEQVQGAAPVSSQLASLTTPPPPRHTLCIQDPVPALWPGSPACPADRRKQDSCLQALASQHCTRLGKQLGPWSRRFPAQTLRGQNGGASGTLGFTIWASKSWVLANLQRLSKHRVATPPPPYQPQRQGTAYSCRKLGQQCSHFLSPKEAVEDQVGQGIHHQAADSPLWLPAIPSNWIS